MKKKDITEAAVYVVIILLVVRIVIMPLYGYVKAKRALLEEYTLSYVTKLNAMERHKTGQKADKDVEERNKFLKGLYSKGLHYSAIQSECLSQLIGVAEKKGMVVLTFEMPEPAITKNISEVPIVIRLKGTPLMFKETLKELEKWEKTIRFKQIEMTAAANTFTVSIAMSVFRIER
jgi:Tfp pilus assembly protein PilO